MVYKKTVWKWDGKKIWNLLANLGYLHTLRDKFENATLFLQIGLPSTCVSVDGKNEQKQTFLKMLMSQQPYDLCRNLFPVLFQCRQWNISKVIMWTENILSVFATKMLFSNLSGLDIALFIASFRTLALFEVSTFCEDVWRKIWNEESLCTCMSGCMEGCLIRNLISRQIDFKPFKCGDYKPGKALT